ncbi:hypothetical protein ACROYT_G032681 [Oculina patagonica]
MEEETEVDGGYDFEFVDELPPCQTCPICFLAMRNPVQTSCGHRFCKTCLLKALRRGNHCPQERNPIPEDEGFFSDVAWKRDILSLRVKCKKSERGCGWTGQLRNYKKHFRMCQYEDVVCDDCDEVTERFFLQHHKTAECRKRIVQCEYCQTKFAFFRTEVRLHNVYEPSVKNHVKNDCLLTMVTCPYKEAGCTFHDKRSNLTIHIEASTEDHLKRTWSLLQDTANVLLDDVEEDVKRLKKDKKTLKRSLKRERSNRKKLEVENEELKKEVKEVKNQLEVVKRTAAEN